MNPEDGRSYSGRLATDYAGRDQKGRLMFIQIRLDADGFTWLMQVTNSDESVQVAPPHSCLLGKLWRIRRNSTWNVSELQPHWAELPV